MPIYEYQCDKCGEFEVTQRITEEPLKKCPTCKRKVRKLISNTSFQLKGSGWYVTDYARKGKDAGKDSSKDSGSAAASGESKASAGDSSASSGSSATSDSKTSSSDSTSSGGEKTKKAAKKDSTAKAA